jgi:hypothetical protein
LTATATFPLALISPRRTPRSPRRSAAYRDQVRLELPGRRAVEGNRRRRHGARGTISAGPLPRRPESGLETRGPRSQGTLAAQTLSGRANALARCALDLGGGACFNDARVQVERVAPYEGAVRVLLAILLAIAASGSSSTPGLSKHVGAIPPSGLEGVSHAVWAISRAPRQRPQTLGRTSCARAWRITADVA